ncbi:MAG: hypothetical protein ACKVVT_05445 [Dehalococcoidia bacterium]
MSLFAFPPRAFVIELEDVPASLPALLEAEGVAEFAARTVEGLYVEPLQSLAVVLSVVERSGSVIYSIRAMAPSRGWQRRAVEAASMRSRLRNPFSPCWLPTITPA